MEPKIQADSTKARAVLARNPVVQEAALTARAISTGHAEFAVFEAGHAFIAATSAPTGVLMPRSLTSSEQQLIERDHEGRSAQLASDTQSTAVPITDARGELVASLTLHCAEPAYVDALYSLARIAATELANFTTSDGDANFYEAIVEGMRDTVLVMRSDLTIAWASQATTSLLGRTPVDFIGKSAADILHPDDLATALDAVVRISQGLEITRLKIRVQSADGSYLPVEVTGMDHSADPTIDGMVMSLRDAQYDNELEAQIEHARRFSRAIIDSLRDGIVATDQFDTVIVANEIVRDMFDIDTDTPAARIDPERFTLINSVGQAHVPAAERSDNEEICSLTTATGAELFVTATRHNVIDDDGHVMGSVTVFHDITAEQRATNKLRIQALHDQLTGLANRRQLEQRLTYLKTIDTPVRVAACFIDLDSFKLINDNHGHRMGDSMVRIAAERLAEQLSETDLLVRQGGDEFVALLVDVADFAEAESIAEKCRKALAIPYEIDEDRFDVTASIGVAMAEPGELDSDRLLQYADLALYAAKNRGRNRVEAFDSALAEAVSNEERQRRILREALSENRLVMHYQPLVTADSEVTTGYEALARIRTRDGAIITPGSFMEAISNTGLMWDLDRAAFTLSCQAARTLAAMSPHHPPQMACNFSSVSLTHPHLISFITKTVADANASSSQITIEITESSAFDAGVDGLKTLSELEALGFRLSLDDFGTGYSSLAHLRDLPISTVKVDRSFISKLGHKNSERAIAEAVVSLANDLELAVVAEGVETAEHLSHVRDLGFGVVQGWHYAPALSLDECVQNWHDAARLRSDEAV